MMAGIKFGVLCLSALGLAYGLLIILASACWRNPWLFGVLVFSAGALAFIAGCGIVGKAMGF